VSGDSAGTMVVCPQLRCRRSIAADAVHSTPLCGALASVVDTGERPPLLAGRSSRPPVRSRPTTPEFSRPNWRLEGRDGAPSAERLEPVPDGSHRSSCVTGNSFVYHIRRRYYIQRCYVWRNRLVGWPPEPPSPSDRRRPRVRTGNGPPPVPVGSRRRDAFRSERLDLRSVATRTTKLTGSHHYSAAEPRDHRCDTERRITSWTRSCWRPISTGGPDTSARPVDLAHRLVQEPWCPRGIHWISRRNIPSVRASLARHAGAVSTTALGR
jgi:hypothetical protein